MKALDALRARIIPARPDIEASDARRLINEVRLKGHELVLTAANAEHDAGFSAEGLGQAQTRHGGSPRSIGCLVSPPANCTPRRT